MSKQKSAPLWTAVDRTSPVARASKAAPADKTDVPVPMLSDVVKLTRQFQRAVRLDTDYGTVEALLGYICQGTARNVLEATARHIVHSTQRAFTWTGPFGGGKSSLAVALCSLVAPDKGVRQTAFDVLSLTSKDGTDVSVAFSATEGGWLVLPVVGFRGGVVDAISECLDGRASTSIVSRTKSGSRQRTALLLKTLAELAEAQSGNGVLLVIDELGKFLESAAVEGDDIYFYQELADLAGRCSGKLVVVGILHQSFEQYAHRLGSELRDEWRKVQGRYIDIPLVAASDEVVELTGRAIESAHPHAESLTVSKQVAQSIRHRRPGLNASFAERLDRCWPLHPVTAALLGPVSKRRFGQNERSTFGFLASAEALSFREFLQSTPVSSERLYTPAAYWDYLQTNLEPSILASPDSHRWSQSVEAIQRTEQREKEHGLHVQLVKTIALIDLFRNGSGLVADEVVLGACVTNVDGALLTAAQVSALLQDLRRWAVVTFKRHLGSWAISEGSDFDLDAALAQALSSIDEPDLAQLGKLVRLQPVLAKRHYCETGTLRWMLPFMIHANRFLEGVAQAQAVCGEPGRSLGRSSAFGAFVVVLPARGQTLRQAANAVRKSMWQPEEARPILVGVPRNGETIRELGRELVAYDHIRRSRSELENDAVARRELDARTADVRLRLEELDGLTFAHLAAHSAIVDELADLSSPEVAELWSIVISIDSNFKPLADESPETVRQFLGSTRLVQDILLSPQFREKASDSLLDPLANFLQLADNVRTLKEQIKAAFPPTEFETTFAGARPSAPADLLQYDFLILDLVLNKSKGAIDEMVAYLLAMGEESYPAKLPAIIIMSNSAELTTERLRFSTESQISAAGLLLLPKAKIREAGFGKEGLILSYQQLDRQRGVAHHMRVFMRTWMRTLESARSKANTTLWNMDASAMQQIHLSAITEDDPYDEHLNELMSREYLWHVESSPDVATALEALEKCFTEKLAPGSVPPAIGTRFIAPLVNAKVGRDLVSHFTWTGFGVPEALDAKSPKEALEDFNKLVPFGAVLAPEVLTSETE